MDELEKLRTQYGEAVKAAKAALADGDLEAAKEANDRADGLKALITEHERVAAAEAEQREAEEKARKAAEEKAQQEIEELATQKAKAMLAKVGLDRPAYGGGEEEDEGPTLKMYSPYDEFSAPELAFGYMVMKAHGVRPSLTYRRAVHGRAVKHVEQGGFKPLYTPQGPAAKRLGRMAQPILYQYKADETVLKALAVKADELMGSDVTSAGDEWIPVFYSRELFRMAREAAMVAPMFRQVEIEGESYTFPVQTGAVTWYKTPQTDDAAEMVYSNAFITSRISQVATSKLTLTPTKASAIVIWTGEMNEQSLVPMLPFLQSEFVESGAHLLDELLISGDETTTNQNISDYGNASISAYWRLLLIDGLRHHCLVDASGANARDGGGITVEDFLATKKLMGTNGKYAVQPSKVAWIMDVATYYKAQALGELLTRDKHIPATIENGEITRIFGSPVVYSEDFAATDSSGYINNTAASNTVGSFMCVRPEQGVIGFGRRMSMETGRIARADAYEIVGHIEIDFDLTDSEFVALSYNLTV